VTELDAAAIDQAIRPRLDGKVAVVTGGSRGIGHAIVHAFARAGADVVIASRKLDNCEAVAKEVRATTGRRAAPVATNVGRWDDCDRLAHQVLDEFGRCDVLVNNAGMSPLYPDLPSITEEYYDKVHAVNAKGPFRLSVVLGTAMVASGGGSIINVSTIGSLRPGPTAIVYTMAKAALNAMTIALADGFAPAVRVNGILPGAIDTDIAATWTEATREAAVRGNPLRRMGTAEDFAGVAVWLASPASAYVNGVLVRVDGGAYRQMS